jgi:hypothetical protein
MLLLIIFLKKKKTIIFPIYQDYNVTHIPSNVQINISFTQ